MKIKIQLILLFLLPISLFAEEIQWSQLYPGVWKGVVGTPEKFDLIKASNVKPKSNVLKKMPDIDFPFLKGDIKACNLDGDTYLKFPLDKEEIIYGLGLQFKTVQRNGQIMLLRALHYANSDNGATHAPVPFYVSSKGYGVLINSARMMNFYVGSGVRKDSKNPPPITDRNTEPWAAFPRSDVVEVLIPASGVEFYVFAGENPLNAVEKYNLFLGGGCLPPRWGLGFTYRVMSMYNDKKVLDEVEAFEKNGFPLDVIGLEPGWQSKSYPCTFEWDKRRFPNPGEFIKTLLDKNVRVNLWTNPYVSPVSEIAKAIEPYTASHTVWGGMVPDLNSPEAVKILGDHLNKHTVSIGVSSFKIDETDGDDRWMWPYTAAFPSGVNAVPARQTYGAQIQKLVNDIYKKQNIRTYGLSRASNAGANSMPFVIYNDGYNHQDFITALINSSFAGVLWTPEVRTSPTAEEWVRRFQTVVFSPMAMINAWSSGTKPWSYPEVADKIRDLAKLRMQLMPYFYTEFAKYHFKGTPPFRAMALEQGYVDKIKIEKGNQNLHENPYLSSIKKEIKDQYMAGEYLLVAPIFTGQKSRKVILPPGNWYDFYTGEYVGNDQTIDVEASLDKIPVYVKDGGIIPMYKERMNAPKPNEKVDLQIRYYGEKEGTYYLYDDDGVSFDYEKGAYSWRKIKVKTMPNGRIVGSISKAENGKPDTVQKVTFIQMTKSKGSK